MIRALAGISVLLFASFVIGCSSSGTPTSSAPPTNATKIKHIVVIMQENRSFDNLFNGFPGADTVQSGSNHGVTVALQPIPFEQGTDLDHNHTGWYADLDGGAMDGFAHEKLPSPSV